MAPAEESSREESDPSSSETEEEESVEPAAAVVMKPKLGFQLPKLPKMPEKSNAHEKLMEWRKYKRSIEFYFGLMEQQMSAQQKLQLLYLGGGTEIQKALEHFHTVSDGDEASQFAKMMEHMDKHFQTGVDGLAYMLQFFNMKQKEDEPFADFAQRLKAQADLCELGTARDNMLKTQIQKGAKNTKVFASAESWVNKSLNDIIGLGIADETGSLPSGTKAKAPPTVKPEEEESVGHVSESNRQYHRRSPRAWRRDHQRGRGRGPYQRGGGNRAGRGSARQYPYSSGQATTGSGGSTVRCYSCNKMGHFARDCRGLNMVESTTHQVRDEMWE